MTVYNLNIGIGWASSGVEYAQFYRANLFRQENIPAKFVFTDFFNENLYLITNNMGFHLNEIISLYSFFSNIKNSYPSITEQEYVQNHFDDSWYEIKRVEIETTYATTNSNCRIIIKKDKVKKEFVDTIWFFVDGVVQKKDHYTYTKTCTELFSDGVVIQRTFYNDDESVSLEEYIDGEDRHYLLDGSRYDSKLNLFGEFLKRLNLTEKDTLLIDRAKDIAPAIIRESLKAKVGVIVHAEHYNEDATDERFVLWNNFYEYQFQQFDAIDFFIVATDRQARVLSSQMNRLGKERVNEKIVTIPVGSIARLQKSNQREWFSLITASRLAKEKHIDWLIKAVVKAKLSVPNLKLEIFGDGGEKVSLAKIISEMSAENYIFLEGHHDLENRYKDYGLYCTASTSEGFGLTLMEAVGSGLPLVGFDVDYGNRTFIQTDKNGYLVPFEKNNELDNVNKLSEAIVKYAKLPESEKKSLSENSLQLAKAYLDEEVRKKWRTLVGGK